ncbi:hypothetical protein LWI29_013516 [Acer saccharum]|uniref:Ubiquinol oxidase n=1 Tax=Acer saccharum TaxID=4024 RepID=A0AA39SCI8_ACESA|nr:hypothetical protein LWI29_013516 [Acer saccharum]
MDEKVVLDIEEEQFHVDVWKGEEKGVQEHFEAQLHVDDLSDDEGNTPAEKVEDKCNTTLEITSPIVDIKRKAACEGVSTLVNSERSIIVYEQHPPIPPKRRSRKAAVLKSPYADTEPQWKERAIVVAVQGVFFNAYFVAYLASPKLAHRIVGYLEEEAVISYTEFLKDLDNGSMENVPAPAIAIDYWRLPEDSTLRDVVMVIRANDQVHHCDLNRYASDIQCQGHELNDAPAPIGYH